MQQRLKPPREVSMRCCDVASSHRSTLAALPERGDWSSLDEAKLQLLAGEELSDSPAAAETAKLIQSMQPLSGVCLRELGVAHAPQAFFDLMARLAGELASLEAGRYEMLGFPNKLNLPEFHVVCAGTPLQLSYVGSGCFGTVFRLKGAGQETFAFKVYHRRNAELGFSGPFGETALGLYVTAHDVRDMPHLCLADPWHGWLLAEFIHDDFRRTDNTGPSWQDLGLQALDNGNVIQTAWGDFFRVDYGHLASHQRRQPERAAMKEQVQALRTRREYLTSEQFMALFEKNPRDRRYLCGQLRCVQPDQRLNAVERMLEFEEMKFFPVQDYLSAGLLPLENTRDLFKLLMSASDPSLRSQAIFDVRGLCEEDRSYLMHAWSEKPEFIAFQAYCGDPDVTRAWLTRIADQEYLCLA